MKKKSTKRGAEDIGEDEEFDLPLGRKMKKKVHAGSQSETVFVDAVGSSASAEVLVGSSSSLRLLLPESDMVSEDYREGVDIGEGKDAPSGVSFPDSSGTS
ncbi:hypothetical protein NE237_008183 [Protea cynaroides]|uniref:Uncharacterized protein n=1 Tax=Protea cynaroides TaxID=273540 RepID=A0A9Q0KRK5_9MAGN|nr:hypothetical protein NE237_008183 [Protea cynaroides]